MKLFGIQFGGGDDNGEQQSEREDFTREELHIIIENGQAIINGTHETAGPEWSPVASAVIRGALKELNESSDGYYCGLCGRMREISHFPH